MIARYSTLTDIRRGKYFVQSYTPGNHAIAQYKSIKKRAAETAALYMHLQVII